MANAAFDMFRGVHADYLKLFVEVRVSFDREADLFCLSFQTRGTVPTLWLRLLRIDLRHDTRPVQETVATDWPDVEGTIVVATCPRPKAILPDEEAAKTGENLLPVGNVILFAGYGGHTRTMLNATSVRVFRDRPTR